MEALNSPFLLGSLELRNRLYRAPVLEGAALASDPGAVYARHFVPNAEQGIALIVQGQTVVMPEGNTSSGMSTVRNSADIHRLAPMVEAVQRAGARLVLQIGHGGSWEVASWQEDAGGARKPWAPSPLPGPLRWVHPGVHVLSTEEVVALVERFGKVARWAREAGYDGVQLAASNAKLLHQFVSPFYNHRCDRFGGDMAGRWTLLREIRQAIARDAGSDFPVLLKLAVQERGGWGARLRAHVEGIKMARLAEDDGFAALTPVEVDVLPNTGLCRGGDAGDALEQRNLAAKFEALAGDPLRARVVREAMRVSSLRYPDRPLWNAEVVGTLRGETRMPMFLVGGVRTSSQAEAVVRHGLADMVGLGRPLYAEPDLAARMLAGDVHDDLPMVCHRCNRCVVPQMLGMAGVCYRPGHGRERAQVRQALSVRTR